MAPGANSRNSNRGELFQLASSSNCQVPVSSSSVPVATRQHPAASCHNINEVWACN